MDHELMMLGIAAVSIALVHTVCGPDHYIPFVAMSQFGNWSLRGTVLVTIACGIGHVASSVLLGGIGIAFGAALARLEFIETARGNVAGWLMIGFGLAYLGWAVVRNYRGKPHTHLHVHSDGSVHCHEHTHHRLGSGQADHVHAHVSPRGGAAQITGWALFTIFVFGPCEPLIPLLMYPAARASWQGVVFVVLLFGVATIATMTLLVVTLCQGVSLIQSHWIHRHSQIIAGLLILLCGLAVNFGL